MLGWLHHFGYTPERNPCSLLLEGSTTGTEFSKRGSAVTRKAASKYAGRIPGARMLHS